MANVNTLSILIDKPVEKVFAYTLDSNNTPKWYSSIAEEKASEVPAKLGTTLKNHGYDSDEWFEVKITEFVPNKVFTLTEIDGPTRCKYVFEPKDGGTQFTYSEWSEDGELAELADISILQKLKNELEREK